MVMTSRRKGKVGEREWAEFLRQHGFADARRGAQFHGSPESPDVVVPSIPLVHWEVKRVEHLRIEEAMKQAMADSSIAAEVPVVAHRKNLGEWLVTMRAEDWCRLMAWVVRQDAESQPKQVLATDEHGTVVALVYNPRETKLVRTARSQGLKAITGLGMLIEQAALAFEIWTGHNPPRDFLFSSVVE